MTEEKKGFDFAYTATTFQGLEEVLAEELLQLGASEVEIGGRAVFFNADTESFYRIMYKNFCALRILKPIHSFSFRDAKGLYDGTQKVNWLDIISLHDTFAVDAVLIKSFIDNSMFAGLKVKDAIVDQFREKYGKRPDIDKDNPEFKINVHVHAERCTISLDASGDTLNKRGYRKDATTAPLNEVLAAGLIRLSGWDRESPFVDPMCGSGTIAIEAAMYASNTPSGRFRQQYGFMKWKDFDITLWRKVTEAANKEVIDEIPPIWASDQSRDAIEIASVNMKAAGMDEHIFLHRCKIQDLNPLEGPGIVMLNPPYGERLDPEFLGELYKDIGDGLKRNFKSYTAWLLTSNREASKSIGLHSSRKLKLFNGSLECRFFCFELYEGSKKAKYNQENEESAD